MILEDIARSLFLTKLRPASKVVPAPAVPAPAVPAAPPRFVEEHVVLRGMLWHPALTVLDDDKLVISGKAGLPHCARCNKALGLAAAVKEAWACSECGDVRPGSDVDFFTLEGVIQEGLKAFLLKNPDFAPAGCLAAPVRALQSA